jgi:hypothetical protein
MTKFGQRRVVGFELFARMDVVVIVIHRSVRVVPALHAFGPVFSSVLVSVTFLLTAKNDQHLVLPGNLDTRVGGLTIDEDISAVETLREQVR